jgi:uncharacterized cupin superfamily protein
MPAPKLRLPALDPATVADIAGTIAPEPYRRRMMARSKRKLGDALGLADFGVNITTLPPGVWSSIRHWHSHEDEFIYVLEGTLTLVTDAGEQTLGPGMAAGFPKGAPDGHHLINNSDKPARYLEIGTRDPARDNTEYPDADLAIRPGKGLVRKDGSPIA